MIYYTTTEQSKKLIELGLNPDTADMYLKRSPILNHKERWLPHIIKTNKLAILFDDDIIPCWSLGALLELISNYIVYHVGNNKTHVTFYSTPRIISIPTHVTKDYDSVIDAAFEMVCWLLKSGYIKKGE